MARRRAARPSRRHSVVARSEVSAPSARSRSGTLSYRSTHVLAIAQRLDELSVTWVGHSTTVLQFGRINFLTDPMWSERASPVSFAGPRRFVRPGISTFEALPPIDVVIISHNHYDHLDRSTVQALARPAAGERMGGAVRLARTLRQWGAERVRELDWWEDTRIADCARRM